MRRALAWLTVLLLGSIPVQAKQQFLCERQLMQGVEDSEDKGSTKSIERSPETSAPSQSAESSSNDAEKMDKGGDDDSGTTSAAAVQMPEAEGMTLEQARLFMLNLINRDRASMKRSPVTLDETASRAGQMHTDEMACEGYLSHWDLMGRKPDQRYTESGGTDYDMENAHLQRAFLSGTEDKDRKLPLAKEQRFEKSIIEEMESDFFNEKPPMDGHRKNILEPRHTKVGIALSLAANGSGSCIACTQEFVNSYATVTPMPYSAKLGDPLPVQGVLNKGLHVYNVDLACEDAPKPMTIDELNATYSYTTPDNSIGAYWPEGYTTPQPIIVSTSPSGDQQFSLNIATSRGWKPGLYYVTVWATSDGDKDPFVISQRTVMMTK